MRAFKACPKNPGRCSGLEYVKIVASGDLNEWKIDELMNKGARIDMFGVGTELITGRPTPALDGIYKLSDVVEHGKHVPKMKLSEEIVKTTLPGKKKVWRIMENGKFKKDIITLENEIVNEGVPLLETVVRKGKIVVTGLHCLRYGKMQLRISQSYRIFIKNLKERLHIRLSSAGD